MYSIIVVVFVFFKHKTAYEMRISDWSSDVCSSDLPVHDLGNGVAAFVNTQPWTRDAVDALDDRTARIIFQRDFQNGLDLVASHLKIIDIPFILQHRSEERRVGKECVITFRSRCSPYH